MGTKDLRKEFERGLKIDKSDFDRVVLEQPELFAQVGEQHVLAVSRRDELKTDIKEAEAELDAEFRRKAERTDEKVTEAGIKSKILATERMKGLQAAFIDASKEEYLWGVLREAYNQRYGMIQTFARLHSDISWMSDSAGRSRSTGEAKERTAERVRRETGDKRDRER